MFQTCILAFLISKGTTAPLLLKKADLVMPVGNWEEAVLTVGRYCWWSPTKILAFIKDEDPKLIDLSNHSSARLSNPILREQGGLGLSPDRSLSLSQEWKGRSVTWSITRVSDRTGVGGWTIKSRTPRLARGMDMGSPGPDAIWSTDGQTLYQLEFWPQGQGATLNAQVVKRDLGDLSHGMPLPVIQKIPPFRQVTMVAGKAWMNPAWRERYDSLAFLEWSLTDPKQVLSSWTMKAPKGQALISFNPSPDLKHLLWTMGRPGKKLLTPENGYPYQAVSLWISGPRGENLRELGEIPFHPDNIDRQMDCYQHFGEVHWNPDSKRFSFIYNRKFYLLGIS